MTLSSKFSWLAGIWIALLALCFASVAQAGTRMYTGSLIIHSFGNDTTTGTAEPYDTGYAVGLPLTGRCNQGRLGMGTFHAKETLMFKSLMLPKGAPNPTTTVDVTFTIPNYGGQVADVDTNGDTIPDIVAGCGPTTQHYGDPLTGGPGPVSTSGVAGVNCNAPGPCTNPRKFTLPNWALRKQRGTNVSTQASFEQYGVYLWEVHFADLHNDVGVFSKNGGDGAFGPIQFKAAKQKRSVVQKAGANQFGGVMRLLGSYGDNEGYYYNNAITSVYYFNWLFHYLGIGGQTCADNNATTPCPSAGNPITGGKRTTYVNFGYTRTFGFPTTSTVYVSLFKWTTGTVTVTAKGGTFPTVLQRKGYDNRTSLGSGTVQMVSPMLTKWVGAGTSATAAIGIMKVSFAPEPSEWLMLGSGVSMLGLLAHRRRSRRR